jgi:hypothetical protein
METCRGLPGDPDPAHTRYIEAAVDGILIGCLYLPIGNPAVGPKFDYKLRWFDRLATSAADLPATGMPVVLAGSPAWPGRGRAFSGSAGDGGGRKGRASVRPTPIRTSLALRNLHRKSSEEGLELAFNSLACEAFIRGQPHEGWSCLPQPYDDRGRSGILRVPLSSASTSMPGKDIPVLSRHPLPPRWASPLIIKVNNISYIVWLRRQSRANPSLNPDSLLAGKMQGISSIVGSMARQRAREREPGQWLTGQFPTHPSWEFFAPLQGIKSGGHGKFPG